MYISAKVIKDTFITKKYSRFKKFLKYRNESLHIVTAHGHRNTIPAHNGAMPHIHRPHGLQ